MIRSVELGYSVDDANHSIGYKLNNSAKWKPAG